MQVVIFFQNLIRRVPVADNVVEFAVSFVSKTRPNTNNTFSFIKEWVNWGAGPRASQYLILGAKTLAILDGRESPDIDDVKRIVMPVLRHRIVTNFNAEAEGITTSDIIDKMFDSL